MDFAGNRASFSDERESRSEQLPVNRGFGWPRVAAVMGRKPELAILRRFRKANTLRLLEMQADLMRKEQDYEDICAMDAEKQCAITQAYQTNWDVFDTSNGEGGCRQRDAWRSLRDGLELYNSALLQQIEMDKHKGPSTHDFILFQTWLQDVEGNNSSLRGRGWDVWEKEEGLSQIDFKHEFVSLSSKHSERDRFERWAGDTLLGVFHRTIGQYFKKNSTKDEEFGLAEYNDARISMASDIICTIGAPLLTTIPMFVLYFVADVTKRLGIVMGFTLLFSITLAMFSSARRIEIFAATSAFAAVQVLYVTVSSNA